MLNIISEILSTFQPITLVQMDSVKLMTRSDAKYQFRIDQLPLILQAAQKDFNVLENLGNRIMGYETLYLDTPDHEMYLMHHNSRLNRNKIRIREYKNSNQFFFEIKHKNSHHITSKKRITIGSQLDYHTGEISDFLIKHSPYTPEMLVPVLFSSFERITLVNCKIQERITIDLNPCWHFSNRKFDLPNLVILEVKSAKPSSFEGFGYLLREARIAPRRISKYCIGSALIYPEIKHNRFKSKLLHLEKLSKNMVYHESPLVSF